MEMIIYRSSSIHLRHQNRRKAVRLRPSNAKGANEGLAPVVRAEVLTDIIHDDLPALRIFSSF